MLELVLEPLFAFAGYWTGKVVLRLLSLGRLHVSMLAEPNDARPVVRRGRPRSQTPRSMGSVTFVRDGMRYVDPEVAAFVGLLTWAVVIATAVLIARRG